jgi:hypothetical protein
VRVDATPSRRGRVVTFRVAAGLFGALALISNLLFMAEPLATEAERHHAFHVLASFAGGGLLVGLPLIALAIRPEQIVVPLRVAWAATLGSVVAGVIGADLVSGYYYVLPLVMFVLTALSPARRSLLRAGGPNVGMLAVAALAAVPAVLFATENGSIMRECDIGRDVVGHCSLHHWTAVASSALGIVLVAAILAFREPGDRFWVRTTGVAAVLFGLASVVFSDPSRYPSSVGATTGALVVAGGFAYVAVAEIVSRRHVSVRR